LIFQVHKTKQLCSLKYKAQLNLTRHNMAPFHKRITRESREPEAEFEELREILAGGQVVAKPNGVCE